MSYITSIRSVLRAFTPKGQELALNMLKRNRATLSEEFGFAYLPRLIAGEGQTKVLENELLDKSTSIRDIVTKQLESLRVCSASEEIKKCKINYSEYLFLIELK